MLATHYTVTSSTTHYTVTSSTTHRVEENLHVTNLTTYIILYMYVDHIFCLDKLNNYIIYGLDMLLM